MNLFTRTESNMLEFCARGGPHAHVRVERCTSTNTLYKTASRTSRESASLNSILLKGSAEYSVVKMLVQFREGKHGVSADIKKIYNNLQLDSMHYKYQMAMWRPNMLPDEEAEELV